MTAMVMACRYANHCILTARPHNLKLATGRQQALGRRNGDDMVERFASAPLVEVTAELRWAPAGGIAAGPQAVGPAISLVTIQPEDFFVRFGASVSKLGYDVIERTVPPGFPVLPFRTVYRFRKRSVDQGTTIFQVGNGVFTANITPPYHSWEQFRPVVAQGFSCLMETRPTAEAQAPFSQLILRYINAFGRTYVGERSAAEFIQDVLGFEIQLPEAIRQEMLPEGRTKAVLQLAIPLKSGQQMNVNLADGFVNAEQSTIVDIGVSQDGRITADEVMDAFDTARGVIHRSFVGMTKKLHGIMQPVGGGA